MLLQAIFIDAEKAYKSASWPAVPLNQSRTDEL